MEIAVVIRKVAGNGYRATTQMPESLAVDGASQDEVLMRMDNLIRENLAGAQVVQLQIPDSADQHPWRRFAGTWKDRPGIQEFMKSMREYREQVDADTERL